MAQTAQGKERVLVMGINFSPELTGIGKYTGEMVEWLVSNDYQCTVVTSFPYYPNWKMQKPYTGRWYKKEISAEGNQVVYRCPMYVPAKPTGMKRILHEISFCVTALLVIFRLFLKPGHDTIFCMAPPFHLGFLALLYRYVKGGRIVYHIHDMQIEAARDLEIIKTKSVFKFLFTLEHYILEHVDHVTTVALGMRKKIVKKTTKEVTYFPNWVAVENFWPLHNSTYLKEYWGFNADDKILLYSGSIGEKQGLESIIQIAQNLRHEGALKFVICGIGPYKETLVGMAAKEGLNNIHFLPLQGMDVFNQFLNMADVHLIIQKKKAGDLMMPSKLTNILAVGGLALVTADPGSDLYEIMHDNEMGVLVPAEDTSALSQAILDCSDGNYAQQRINGLRYAKKNLNRQNILESVLSNIGMSKGKKVAVPTPVGNGQWQLAQ